VRNRSTWVGWGILAFGCVGNAAAVAVSVAGGSFGQNPGEVPLVVVFGAFLVVGCLILVRRPGNVIGWIFTAVGLLTMIAGLAEAYAKYAYAHPGSLPAPLVAVWVFNWIWNPIVILILVFPLLLFPTGGLDLPPGGGHRGYAAVVDSSGLMVACWCSHSMGGRKSLVECSRRALYQAIQRKIEARAWARVR
jgi:hypothetical protein